MCCVNSSLQVVENLHIGQVCVAALEGEEPGVEVTAPEISGLNDTTSDICKDMPVLLNISEMEGNHTPLPGNLLHLAVL